MQGLRFHPNTFLVAWLEQRKMVLKLFMEVSLPGKENLEELQQTDAVNNFFQILIDYVACGHFKVFVELLNVFGTKAPESVSSIMSKLYQSTAHLMWINAKYTNPDMILESLSKDLEKVGMIIADRLDLEDALIHTWRLNTKAVEQGNAYY